MPARRRRRRKNFTKSQCKKTLQTTFHFSVSSELFRRLSLSTPLLWAGVKAVNRTTGPRPLGRGGVLVRFQTLVRFVCGVKSKQTNHRILRAD